MLKNLSVIIMTILFVFIASFSYSEDTINISKLKFYYLVNKNIFDVKKENYLPAQSGSTYMAYYTMSNKTDMIIISAKDIKGHTDTFKYNLYNYPEKFFINGPVQPDVCKVIDKGRIPYGYKDGAYAVYDCNRQDFSGYIYNFGSVYKDIFYSTQYILTKSNNRYNFNLYEKIRQSIVIYD